MTTTLKTITLKTITLGAHTINGTDWPVVAELRRFKAPTGRAVYTVAQVCNGSAHTAENFRRLSDAEAHIAGLIKAYAAPVA
jgi:hypothetical protein